MKKAKKSLVALRFLPVISVVALTSACDEGADDDMDLDALYEDLDDVDPEQSGSGKADETGVSDVRRHYQRLRFGEAEPMKAGSLSVTYGGSDERVGGTPFAVRQGAVEIIQCRIFGNCNTDDDDILAAAEALDCGLGATDVGPLKDRILSFYAPEIVPLLANRTSGLGGKALDDNNLEKVIGYRAYSDGWIDMCHGKSRPDIVRIFAHRK